MDSQDAFAHSWDLVECTYALEAQRDEATFKPALELVREMRRRGYDRLFRAGTAALSLVLSRSAEHGLRADQPWVQVFVWPRFHAGMSVSSGPGEGTRFVEESFAITPALERVLAELAQAPIECYGELRERRGGPVKQATGMRAHPSGVAGPAAGEVVLR